MCASMQAYWNSEKINQKPIAKHKGFDVAFFNDHYVCVIPS